MPNNTENLPLQSERDEDVLGFSTDELLAELESVFGIPAQEKRRQPGDMDERQLCLHFGCSQETVRTKMADMVATGKWRRIRAIEPDGAKITVYRRVK